MAKKSTWANLSALYQIYPRSFKDTDNDGVGDLPGIIQKLDYLKGTPESLGVDAVWFSPFFASPMADFGYDISDYRTIDPLFGTLADFEHLVAEAHKRGLRVMLDFVPNHTSDRHAWFQQSRSSRDNPKRDWYIWRDPQPDGSAPNNWLGAFDGSAWEYDADTRQYYLHSFLKQQPDLNWANPDVRKAMQDVLHFWFQKGVDGFRVDAVSWLAKDRHFQNDPPNPAYDPRSDPLYDSLLHKHSRHAPKLFEYLSEMAGVAKQYDSTLLITETYPDRTKDPHDYSGYMEFYRKVDASVLVPFNFEPISLPWNATAFQKSFDIFHAHLRPHEMPVHAFSNHDMPRIVARYGAKQARVIAVISLSLPGLPLIYYGDELGLDNVRVPLKARQDPVGWIVGDTRHRQSRDPVRSPMPWTSAPRAGFSRIKPWLPIGQINRWRSVTRQQHRANSILNLYRQLLDLRRTSNILQQGTYEPVNTDNPHIFAFIRNLNGQKLATICNFSKRWQASLLNGEVLISTHKPHPSKLQPLEARIIKID